MFETYLQSYDGQPTGRKYLLQNTSNVLLSSLLRASKDVVVMSSKQNGNQLLQLRDDALNILKELVLSGNVTTLRGNGDTFLITLQNATGTFSQVYTADLELLKEWALSEKYLAVEYFNGFAYYLKQVSATYYNLLTTDDGKSSVTTGCDLRFSPTDMIVADQLYIVGSSNGLIYLNYNCTATIQLGFGSSASVSVSKRQSGQSQQLQVLISDGMCQSAVFANNN